MFRHECAIAHTTVIRLVVALPSWRPASSWPLSACASLHSPRPSPTIHILTAPGIYSWLSLSSFCSPAKGNSFEVRFVAFVSGWKYMGYFGRAQAGGFYCFRGLNQWPNVMGFEVFIGFQLLE